MESTLAGFQVARRWKTPCGRWLAG